MRLNHFLFLACLTTSPLLLADQKYPEAIITSVSGEACIKKLTICEQAITGQYIYPYEHLLVTTGSVVIYSLKGKIRLEISEGEFHMNAIAPVAITDRVVAKKISRLMKPRNRNTASQMTRSDSKAVCPEQNSFKTSPDWLKKCVEQSTNANNGSFVLAPTPLQLPRFSMYSSVPTHILTLSEANKVFISTVKECKSVIPSELKSTLLSAWENNEPTYLLDFRPINYVTYGLAKLPAACEESVDKEVAAIQNSNTIRDQDKALALHEIYFNYGLNYDAMKAIESINN